MTNYSFKKFVLTPVMVSMAAFAVLVSPLAISGSKPVTIYFQKEPVFYGKLREISTPYLLLATLLSLGTGTSSVALSGWLLASRKSSKVKAQLLNLKQSIKETEAQIEALKSLDTQRKASSPIQSIDEELIQKQELKDSATHLEVSNTQWPSMTTVLDADRGRQGTTSVTMARGGEDLATPRDGFENVSASGFQPPRQLTATSYKEVEPLIITTQPIDAQPMTASPVRVQATASRFVCTQTFLGYAHRTAFVKSCHMTTPPAANEVDELHTQLQQIMAQLTSMQTSLCDRAKGVASESQGSASTQVVGLPSWRLLQVIK